MTRNKVSTLNLRVNPAIKEAVRKAAAAEHRSVANMVEMLIRRHCDAAGIDITEARGDDRRPRRAAAGGNPNG